MKHGRSQIGHAISCHRLKMLSLLMVVPVPRVCRHRESQPQGVRAINRGAPRRVGWAVRVVVVPQSAVIAATLWVGLGSVRGSPFGAAPVSFGKIHGRKQCRRVGLLTAVICSQLGSGVVEWGEAEFVEDDEIDPQQRLGPLRAGRFSLGQGCTARPRESSAGFWPFVGPRGCAGPR